MPRCPACAQDKPRGDFYANPSRGTGLMQRCKVCHNRERKRRHKRAKVRRFLAELAAVTQALPAPER